MSRTPHRALAALSVAALALTGCSVSGSSGDGASSSASGAAGGGAATRPGFVSVSAPGARAPGDRAANSAAGSDSTSAAAARRPRVSRDDSNPELATVTPVARSTAPRVGRRFRRMNRKPAGTARSSRPISLFPFA